MYLWRRQKSVGSCNSSDGGGGEGGGEGGGWEGSVMSNHLIDKILLYQSLMVKYIIETKMFRRPSGTETISVLP